MIILGLGLSAEYHPMIETPGLAGQYGTVAQPTASCAASLSRWCHVSHDAGTHEQCHEFIDIKFGLRPNCEQELERATWAPKPPGDC